MKYDKYGTIRKRIQKDRENFLDEFRNCHGIVAIAARAISRNRDWVYKQRAKSKRFVEKMDEIRRIHTQIGEDKLMQAVADGHVGAIMFLLGSRHPDYKPQLKHSGEVETRGSIVIHKPEKNKE